MSVPSRPSHLTVHPGSVAAGGVSPANIVYRGCFGLPVEDGVTLNLSFATGALAGRVVNGEARIFVTGHPNDGHEVYEFTVPTTLGTLTTLTRGSLVRKWGDVYQGKKLVAGTGETEVRGLLWTGSRLLWAYGLRYAGNSEHAPSIGLSRLNDDGSVQAFGPWRTAEHSQRTKGYLVRSPRGEVGYGAPISAGNSESPWGAECVLGPVPDETLAPSPTNDQTSVAIPTTRLIHHDFTTRQARETDWTHCYWVCDPTNPARPAGCQGYYDSSFGGTLVPGEPVFNALDQMTAAAWVVTPSGAEGVIYFGQMASGHQWYGPNTCPHGKVDPLQQATGDASEFRTLKAWIFDPANPVDVPAIPVSAWWPDRGAAGLNYQFGGCWFDASSHRLYLSEVSGDHPGPYSWQPAIHVFDVRD